MRRFGSVIVVAALAAALVGCGKSGGSSAGGEAAAPAPEAPPATAAEKQALLASLPAPYDTGDLANGEIKFGVCRSCHTINAGGPNMTGPNLHGVFGGKAGSHPDFNYSEGMKTSGVTWDAPTIDRWIADPRTMIPGTKMSFAGLKDPKDRIDLIAYLKVESSYPSK
jgi:cytochrome c